MLRPGSARGSDRDPLHFIERDLIARPVVELRCARRFMRGNGRLPAGQEACPPRRSSVLSIKKGGTSARMAHLDLLFSYSHRDESLRDQLDNHLSLLKREGQIQNWHDRKIGAGQDFGQSIIAHLETADIILLLISADFLASDYCYSTEMQKAVERHNAGVARVIPVILRPVDWHTAPFGKLLALPTDGKAITTWPNIDEALTDVARGIRQCVQSLLADRKDAELDKPLLFQAMNHNANYLPGTAIGGIPWSSRFSDSRLMIVNQAPFDYTDIDLSVRPDRPIAAIGQVTKLPDVFFTATIDPAMRQEVADRATGQRLVNPLMLIATNGGYRVRCKTLPKNSRLEMVIATAGVIDTRLARKPGGGLFDRDYVLRFKNDASGIAHWYGHGHDENGFIEDVYTPNRRMPKAVQINGDYCARQRQRTVSVRLEPRDFIQEAIETLRK
jgi:hypothetical protein